MSANAEILEAAGNVRDGIEISMIFSEGDPSPQERAAIVKAMRGSTADQIDEAFRHASSDRKAAEALVAEDDAVKAAIARVSATPAPTPKAATAVPAAPAPAPRQPNPAVASFNAAIEQHLESINVARSRNGKPPLTRADLDDKTLASLLDAVVPDQTHCVADGVVDPTVMSAVRGRFK